MLVFESLHFIVEAVDNPLVDRADGGHLAIHPKWIVSTRQQLNAEQATDLMRLTMVVGEAFTLVMNAHGVDVGRINYQDNGNWSVFSPDGPALHVHIYGRAKSAKIQKYGETLDFPHRAKHPHLYDKLQPLHPDDVVALRKKIKQLFNTEKYSDATWLLRASDQTPRATVKGIMFDVIGTTVIEKDPNTITDCFENAFRRYGVPIDHKVLQSNRGRDKKEMIALLVGNQKSNMVSEIYEAFIENVKNNIENFQPRPGAEELFGYLRKKNIFIALGTGLSEDLFSTILQHVGWGKNRFNYVGIPGATIRSRPHPDMLLDFMSKCSLQPGELLKVGDTVADIQEGRNAGVATVSILASTQPREDLEKEKPDYIIQTLDELKRII